MDEKGLARLQAAALEHVGPDGEIGLGDGPGLDHGQAGGDRERVDLVDHRVIRIAAAGHQGHDGVADGKSRRVLGPRRRLAGDLETRGCPARRAAADSGPAAAPRPAG